MRACKAVLSAARNARELEVSLQAKGDARGVRAMVQAHKDVYRPKGGNPALIKDLNEYVYAIHGISQEPTQEQHPHAAFGVKVSSKYPPHRRILGIEAEAARREEDALKSQADEGWTVVVRGKVWDDTWGL